MQKNKQESPLKRIIRLRKEVLHHTELYNQGKSCITDLKFDLLYAELAALEDEFPGLVPGISPVHQIVGKKGKIKHLSPMLSIANSYNIEDTRRACNRMEGNSYVAEPKLDGLSLSIRYVNGRLACASTRGDGQFGEDATTTAVDIPDIPNYIDYSGIIEVRGEVFITYTSMNQLNQKVVDDAHGAQYKHPRNAAVGIVNSHTTGDRCQHLSFLAYGADSHFLHSHLDELYGQQQLLLFLSNLGFKVVSCTPINPDRTKDLDTVFDLYQADHELPTDGVVVKVDSLSHQLRLGHKTKNFAWCFAYKKDTCTATTKIRSVDFQVGKSGVITPVANLIPVELSGATIRRVSLYNFEEVLRLKIAIGDEVEIKRAGEIIPKIIRRTNRGKPRKHILEPTKCPCCRHMLESKGDEVNIYCPNPLCKEKILAQLVHFVSKDAMDIKHLGVEGLHALTKKGNVRHPADLMCLPTEEYQRILGRAVGLKVAHQIIDVMHPQLWRLIHAMGIPGVGKTQSKKLAEAKKTAAALIKTSRAQLTYIGLTRPAAIAFHEQFPHEMSIYHRVGVVPINPREKEQPVESLLAGKTIVITGTLSKLSRGEAIRLAEQCGATVKSSVSSRVDLLVGGSNDHTTNKLSAAVERGIRVVDEHEFYAMLPQLKKPARSIPKSATGKLRLLGDQ